MGGRAGGRADGQMGGQQGTREKRTDERVYDTFTQIVHAVYAVSWDDATGLVLTRCWSHIRSPRHQNPEASEHLLVRNCSLCATLSQQQEEGPTAAVALPCASHTLQKPEPTLKFECTLLL